MVAEEDDWKKIVASWIKLERYLLPVLSINGKTYTVTEIQEMLQLIESKPLVLQQKDANATNRSGKATKDEDSTDIFDDRRKEVQNRYNAIMRANQPSTTSTDSSADDSDEDLDEIEYLNEAAEVMTEFQQLIVLAKSVLKKAAVNTNSKEKLLNSLKEKELNEMMKISNRLDKFLKSQSGKDPMLQKLKSQYTELKSMFERDVLKNEMLKDILAASKASAPAKFVGYSQQASANKKATSGKSVDTGNGSAMLLAQDMPRLTTSQQSTIQVEKAIAIETRTELLKIEKDFHEINELARDMNMLLSEQGLVLEQVDNNVEFAAYNIQVGNENLKKAKNYARFKPL